MGTVLICRKENRTVPFFPYVSGPGLDEPLRMIRGGTATYYHADALGSPVTLTNASGQLVERLRYDVFGQPFLTDAANTPLAQSSVGNRFGFTGREYEAETGLYYYRSRYYDPRLGRFLSRDPLGSLPDVNLYRYVGNSPVNFVDPFGFDKAKPWWQSADNVFFPSAYAGEEGTLPSSSWWDWYINETVVPGPRGQPLSEWGPHGPTSWGDPLKYTEAAGGAWIWGERAALGTAAAATAVAVAAGTGAFSKGGWLNSNPYLRIGWGRHQGRVFRIAGEWVKRLTGREHIDLWRGGP